ncbi:MAG: DUF3472 domain-containing protein [Bacteroidota bacterium]
MIKNLKIFKGVGIFFVVLFLIACSSGCEENPTNTPSDTNFLVSVPCEGNSWVFNNSDVTRNIIVEGGIKNWTNASYKIRTYFYAESTGNIEVGLKAKFTGATKLKVTLDNESKEVSFSTSDNFVKYEVGTFSVDQKGYHYIELEGLQKEGPSFGEISDILLGEDHWSSKIAYVDYEWFYWGRRGPSVHLSYEAPANKNIVWFYNEMTIPEGNDPIGSYFMANGFSSGYFGIQVNSETERRVLFSVWSAYDTQDPNQIPEEYKVMPLGQGKDVMVGEFGNEGSGAQSYFVYNWKAGTTYRFLLKGESLEDNTIDYTAYFYAPEKGDWKLIASFRRPFPKGKHLTSLHSFLENFYPSTGDTPRKVNYTNQWVYDTEGVWHEMNSARFTTDNTGASGVRFDYDGGEEENGFYLRNCGFFSDNKNPNTSFTRTSGGTPPDVDFGKLEVPVIQERTFPDRSGWSIEAYSTQEDQGGEGTTGRAKDILDGDLDTYWHSCWSGCTAAPPHYIIVDMGQSQKVDGFRFNQRQSLSRSVKSIELQISDDNSNWESLEDFNLQNTIHNQDIDLDYPKEFRYFKFIVKSAYDGTDHAAIAEIAPYILD